MRRNLMVALALSAVLAGGIAAIAAASSTKIVVGNLELTFGGTFSPEGVAESRIRAGHREHRRQDQDH